MQVLCMVVWLQVLFGASPPVVEKSHGWNVILYYVCQTFVTQSVTTVDPTTNQWLDVKI
jgi:hypothetical protein